MTIVCVLVCVVLGVAIQDGHCLCLGVCGIGCGHSGWTLFVSWCVWYWVWPFRMDIVCVLVCVVLGVAIQDGHCLCLGVCGIGCGHSGWPLFVSWCVWYWVWPFRMTIVCVLVCVVLGVAIQDGHCLCLGVCGIGCGHSGWPLFVSWCVWYWVWPFRMTIVCVLVCVVLGVAIQDGHCLCLGVCGIGCGHSGWTLCLGVCGIGCGHSGWPLFVSWCVWYWVWPFRMAIVCVLVCVVLGVAIQDDHCLCRGVCGIGCGHSGWTLFVSWCVWYWVWPFRMDIVSWCVWYWVWPFRMAIVCVLVCVVLGVAIQDGHCLCLGVCGIGCGHSGWTLFGLGRSVVSLSSVFQQTNPF